MIKAPRSWAVNDPRIAGRVSVARSVSGLSQVAVVRGTGYSSTYMSRVERGLRAPTPRFLRAIAPALRVSAAWLETGLDMVEVELPRDVAIALLEDGYVGLTDELDVALMAALSAAVASTAGQES